MGQDAVAVVKAVFEALHREDVATVLSLFADDVEITEPESLPFGGTHRGKEAVTKNLLMTIGRKLQVRMLRTDFIGGEKGTVAARADIEFTSRKTGRTLTMPYVELHTVVNGKDRIIQVFPGDSHRLLQFWEQN